VLFIELEFYFGIASKINMSYRSETQILIGKEVRNCIQA